MKLTMHVTSGTYAISSSPAGAAVHAAPTPNNFNLFNLMLKACVILVTRLSGVGLLVEAALYKVVRCGVSAVASPSHCNALKVSIPYDRIATDWLPLSH